MGFKCEAAVAGAGVGGFEGPLPQLSGMFFPLPKVMEPWEVIWPAYHLNRTALAAAGMQVDSNPLITGGVLVGITVLLGGLAIRRLARSG